MEKIILYLALIISSCSAIYLSYKRVPVDENASYMNQKWATELGLMGKAIPDTSLKKVSNGQVTSLEQEINQPGDFVLFMTSQDVCSTCRDRELKAWLEFQKLNRHITIFFLIAEDHPLDDQAIIKSRGMFPNAEDDFVLIDTAGVILPALNLKPKETPVALYIHWETKKIALCDQAFPESGLQSNLFREKIKSLSETL